MESPIQVTLKNGILKPSSIVLNISLDSTTIASSVLLKINNQISSSLSEVLAPRKYIFVIQQLDEETEPLSAGDQHTFQCFKDCQSGKYHLTCINYPKLQCLIQVIHEEATITNERKSNTIINLSGLQAVQEKQEQNKQDFGKQEIQQAKNQEIQSVSIKEKQSDSLFGTPKIKQMQDFDKILSSQKQIEETIQNRYLRYFQEQFRIWRNFFEEKQSQQLQKQVMTPTKQKPKSQHGKNSENIQQSKLDSWSKGENYSPNLKFTYSCGSASNNENFSEFDKEKSELTNLRSYQDNYRIDDQLQKQCKVMKKTNSEYRLNIQNVSDICEKKDSQAKTASKQKDKKVKIGSFMEWLDFFTENEQLIKAKQKDDEHIVKQWLGHLKNKYKVGKFMYE